MSQFCVYIKLQPFVAQFLAHSLGNPITFPAQSVENLTLHTMLTLQPKGVMPDTAAEGLTAIAIPDSKTKPPCSWFHLTTLGKKAVVECCEALFMRCLWSELGDVSLLGCKTSTAIAAWCQNHGIDIEHADTVRQRYYRLRDLYKNRGIGLMKKNRVRD